MDTDLDMDIFLHSAAYARTYTHIPMQIFSHSGYIFL